MARRSIRQYTKQTISRDTLDQIIKCGINAPNGQNRQAYEIRVVNNPQILKDISDAVIKTIAKRRPVRAVFRDSCFSGSPAKINVAEIFKMLAPDSRVKVI